MAPKKDKGKGKEEQQAAGAITEVEKTLLELQIAECNRKIARLRTAVEEYEARNEELQNAYDKLDEDRADIIAYLKKMLTIKTEENNELKEKVKGLEEIREIETAQFKETVAELEKNFAIMKDQLTAENKLLAGKLNTLEEFRAIRDDLMRKFEKQEKDFKEQEVKYKTIIYEAEKKFVISKDKLKKEMEERLLQLAQDFQDATELRIAASTHRVIRENIAINHELDSLLATQAKLATQNEKFRENERKARISKELAEEEKDKTINKNVVQLKVINKLTNAFEEVKKEKALLEKRGYDVESLQLKVQKCTEENEKLTTQIGILEQTLQSHISEQNKTMLETSRMAKESEKLRQILKEAAFVIQGALKLDQWAVLDPSREVLDRQALLSQLLEILTQYQEIQRAESTDSAYRGIYKEGDLGFIAKPISKKSLTPTVVSQTSKYTDKEKEVETSKPSVASRPASAISVDRDATTITPSIKPESSATSFTLKDSVESVITVSETVETSEEAVKKDEYRTEMTKQLEASKLEIRKSIMKDLAYSQMAFKSHARQRQERERASKSVVIVETQEVREKDEETIKTEEAKKTEILHESESKQETEDVEDETEQKKDEAGPEE